MREGKRTLGFVETPLEIARLMVSLSSVTKDGEVLDPGCGTGAFLKVLNEFGYRNVTGIELCKKLADLSRQRFRCYRIIHGDFLEHEFQNRFDLIIGNPPYVHYSRLPENMALRVRKMLRTGECDIYYAFIMRAVELLRSGGELIFITPYHFFYNTHARIVREKLLANGRMEIVIDLDEVQLFDGERPETVIFKFRKGEFDLRNEEIEILRVRNRRASLSDIFKRATESLTKKSSNDIFEYRKMRHFLSPESWSTSYVEASRDSFLPLWKFARVGVGLVSGFERAFVVRDLKKFGPEERELIKKFVKSKHCRRYLADGHALYILIEGSVQEEKTLREKYPNIYNHLLPYKGAMSGRYLPKNKKWFHWQALRNYRFLSENSHKRRIVVPALDRKPYNRFCICDGDSLPSGDVLFVQPYNDDDIFFLVGYLNSFFFREHYLATGGRRGGRISFTQKLLENAGIPPFSRTVRNNLSQLTADIILRIARNENADTLERESEEIIRFAVKNEDFSETF